MDISHLGKDYDIDFINNNGGFFVNGDEVEREIACVDSWDSVRRDMLILLLRMVISNNVKGDFCEVGVYKGFTAKLMHYYAPEKELHLFDTFSGFDSDDISNEKKITNLDVKRSDFLDTSIERVREYIAPKNNNIYFYAGYFPESFPKHLEAGKFAFVHLDADLYTPIKNSLELFYPLVSPGGVIVVHDYNSWPGARKAVDEFVHKFSLSAIPLPDKSGSIIIIFPNV
jgi:O-methyltransferase